MFLLVPTTMTMAATGWGCLCCVLCFNLYTNSYVRKPQTKGWLCSAAAFFRAKKAWISFCGSGSDENSSGRSILGGAGGSPHPFPAPRVISRVVNGSLVGAFLPQTLILLDHSQCVIIKWVAKLMHDSQWYSMRREYVEHRIYLLVACDPFSMTHHVEIVMKCPTIHLEISTKCFTYWDDRADVEECQSHRASVAVSEALPSPGVFLWKWYNILHGDECTDSVPLREWSLQRMDCHWGRNDVCFPNGLHHGVEPLASPYNGYEFWWD